MKKYNYLLSLFMVPAMVLQAGNTTPTTCSGTASGSVTLPATVSGVQTFNYSTSTLYNFKVTSASAGVFVSGTSYGAWCTDPAHQTIPGGGINPNGTMTPPEDSANSSGVEIYKPVNSTTITSSVTAAYGNPGYALSLTATTSGPSTTYLTVMQEWSAVNWILNNPNGTMGEKPTTSDTQAAIWQLLHPEGDAFTGAPFVRFTTAMAGDLITGESWVLYNDAVKNGTAFTPMGGQYVGILMVPTVHTAYQGFVIPFPIPCTTTAGSATITKTSNVSSSGANAFQLVTYTYTIRNTGSLALQNLVIVDDNGTPGYMGDDVTVNLPAGTTLAAGASVSVTSTVYLPISLFYQSGSQASFDTLIPQIVPVPAGSPTGTLPSLLLTYLIDSDVTDNTYGTHASAAWAGNGGHTIAQIEAGYAEFAFYNSKGTVTSDFTVDYLSQVDKGAVPAANLMGAPSVGGTSFIASTDSTMVENLLNPLYATGFTQNSPVLPAAGWQPVAGYKVLVNEGIFGVYNTSFSATVKKNYLANTETGFSGKCGSAKAATYTPTICGNVVTSTAYLVATVCGCTTVIHSKCSLPVKCAGSIPTCNSSSNHICQNPVHCSCTCAQCAAGNHGNCTNTTWWGAAAKCTPPVCSCTCPQCKSGNHGSCTQVGCTDPTCHANNCNHNTVKCVIASKPTTLCW